MGKQASGAADDYRLDVPASSRNQALMLKLRSGETIYVSASFAGSQQEFRHLTNRAALEKVQALIGDDQNGFLEAPRIVLMA